MQHDAHHPVVLPPGLTYQFQPIVAADGTRLLAYETLARRAMRDGTIQGPDSFIAQLLEPPGIAVFTRHSLEFALRRLAEDPDLQGLSVNLSPRQAELQVTYDVLVAARPEDRRRLLIELTEDPIVDFRSLAAVLKLYAALGVRILLDDISGGWKQRCSALLDSIVGLKIDRNLIGYMATDPLPRGARSLFEYAAANGLILVAEGVEDEAVMPLLTQRGDSHFQGFILGEPWPEPRVARRHIVRPRQFPSGIAPAQPLLSGFDES